MKWLEKCRESQRLKVSLYEDNISYDEYAKRIMEVLRS